NQFIQADLTGDRLRNSDHRREIQLLDRRRVRAFGARRLLAQVRMGLVQLTDLAVGAPTDIAGPRVPLIGVGDRYKAARRMESCRELVAKTFILDEAMLMRRTDS